MAPSTSVPPTLSVDGETQHRGSSLAGRAGRPAKAVESTPDHTDVGTHVAVDATRLRGSAPPPNDAGLALREKRTAMAHAGLSAGSSGSSSAGPLGIIAALVLIFLPRWFRMLLVPERWRTTVFLTPRERPG